MNRLEVHIAMRLLRVDPSDLVLVCIVRERCINERPIAARLHLRRTRSVKVDGLSPIPLVPLLRALQQRFHDVQVIRIGKVEDCICLRCFLLDEVEVGKGAPHDAGVAKRRGDGRVVFVGPDQRRDLQVRMRPVNGMKRRAW